MKSGWRRFLYQPCLPLGEDGRRITGSKEHIELSRAAASEGMVLLKNEGGILPLKQGTKIALFGKGTADYVKGGGGSGDVTVAYTRNIYEGMKIKEQEGKVEVFHKLAEFYEGNVAAQYAGGAEPGMTREPELPEGLFEEAVQFADTAVFTVSRFSGEGWDRKTVVTDSYKLDPGEQRMFDLSASLFENGDFCLTEAERRLAEKLCAAFPKVIVVLNVGGMVDTSWFKDNDRIQGALLAWQGGIEGGLAAADVLTGDVNPCGHLTDTFAARLEDYPSTESFHESADHVDYTEDIYVGYRYFETIPGAKEKVCYPFGYGLSYSEFLIMPVFCQRLRDEIVLSVKVTNLSMIPGKEVVQVYAALPQGKLGKPALTLVSFAKTGFLGPGVSQELKLNFPVRNLASYDDLGKVCRSAWILEAGEYRFYVGNHIRSLQEVPFRLQIDETELVEQLSEKAGPRLLKKRMLADGSFEELPVSGYEDRPCLPEAPDFAAGEGKRPIAPFPEGICFADRESAGGRILLEEVAEGKNSLDEFLDQLSLEEMISLLGGQPNTGVANTFGMGNLPACGVPNVMTADGPAGLRIRPECGVTTTAWPCATALACTWDRDLIERVGEAAAMEVKENNIGIWLAPAINIHRSPLCGRNFEYYSEDPLVAGLCAGALVHGVQSQKVGVSVKHFCANNKETNRKDSDSRVSERALREIYLRAFELIVKNEQPLTVMSSYNLLNGVHTSENKDLLTGILREEWGFEGIVTTDWWTHGDHPLEAGAGNDVKMAAGYPERVKEAVERGILTREEVRTCAGRILRMILRLA